MPSRSRKQSVRAGGTGAIERLYMMYFAGVVLVLLAIIVLAIFTTSRLARQAARYGEMVERIATLQAEIERLGGDHTGTEKKTSADEPTTRSPQTQPAPTSDEPSSGAGQMATLDSAAIIALVEQCVRPAPRGMFEIADMALARELLERATAAGSDEAGEWDGAALVSLAVLSRLLNDENHARQFSAAARAAGFDASAYDEFTARALLDADRPAEAGLFASALLQSKTRSSQGAVLQAASFVARRNLSAARKALLGLERFDSLADYDRLRLAGVLVELERWDELQRALQGLDDVAPDMAYERDLLRGIWLISSGSLPEADAVLAFLLEQEQDDYTVITWRGVVLMRARQPEAARAALVRATDLAPGRPEAWYWLAVLEINREKHTEGEQYLNKALAASALYAPAWEALATIALKRGEIDAALNHLGTAVRHDAGRADAHFLIALCYAQKSQRDQAAAALRTAFGIDATFVDRAGATDVFAKMFDRSELEALLPQEPAAKQPVARENP